MAARDKSTATFISTYSSQELERILRGRYIRHSQTPYNGEATERLGGRLMQSLALFKSPTWLFERIITSLRNGVAVSSKVRRILIGMNMTNVNVCVGEIALNWG